MHELARRVDPDAHEPEPASEARDLLVGDARHDEIHRSSLAMVRVRAGLGDAVPRDHADLRHPEMHLDAVDERQRPRIDRVLVSASGPQHMRDAIEVGGGEPAVVPIGGDRERLAAVDRGQREHRPPAGVAVDRSGRGRVPSDQRLLAGHVRRRGALGAALAAAVAERRGRRRLSRAAGAPGPWAPAVSAKPSQAAHAAMRVRRAGRIAR